jgi:peptidyl-prolyl cis-trans isomerase C
MPMAHVLHILVSDEKTCEELKARIEAGESFTECARTYSKCPTGRLGGNLGVITPGKMVEEFEEAVLNAEVGKVQGPVKTRYGYHLILVKSRTR